MKNWFTSRASSSSRSMMIQDAARVPAMSTQPLTTRSTTFKIGWITLLILSALFTLWHIALGFIAYEPLLGGWVAFPLYSAVVLYIPFRRGEKWAWYASWILVLGFASPILFETTFGVWYFGVSQVMALALLLTRSAFFRKR